MKKIQPYINKGKIFSKDFALRLSSTAVTTIASKLVVLPFLASMLPAEDYGLMLTIIGIESVITLTLGNTLYTVRMVMNADYLKKNYNGDFNLIIIFLCVLSGLFILPFLFIFPKVHLIDKILLIPYSIFATANTYFRVYYAITLKFKKGLFQAIVSSFGLIIGVVISWITHSWVVCFLSSAVFSLVWIAHTTDIFKESYKVTPLVKITLNKFFLLMIATSLSSGLVYLDRFILYPIISPKSVAIFITASYFGKIVSMLSQPISSVMLSYFAQSGYSMTKRKLGLINIIVILTLGLFIIVVYFFGSYITGVFFPSLIEEAIPYIFVASISACISALAQLVSPIALKFAKTKYLTIIQMVYAFIYLIFGVLLSKRFGLMGFCYLVLVLNIIHFIILDLLCYFSIRNKSLSVTI